MKISELIFRKDFSSPEYNVKLSDFPNDLLPDDIIDIYRFEGNGLSSSNMNYNYLSKQGYDSLYVEPGDGLLNSEYIVYNKEQTTTGYLVWLK